MDNVVHNKFIRLILKILIFIFLFSYLFPIEFTFLPFTTARFAQFVGLVYFIYTLLIRKLPLPIIVFWGGAVIILCIGFWATSIFNQANDYSVIQVRGIYTFLYTVSAYLIVSLIRKTTNVYPLYVLIEWMVIATCVYALFSFVLFLNHDMYALYSDYIVSNDRIEEANKSLIQVRLIGLSQLVQYANAAVFYGIVMWAAIFAYKNGVTFLARHKWLFYIIISLFVTAGIFSGRTFFIIMLLTIVYVFLLNGKKNFWKSTKECILLFSPVAIIAASGILFFLANNQEAMDWAFELIINLQENGEVRSNSTDILRDMYQILPDNMYTWLVGDGRADNGDGTFYMGTDSGYLRSIFYWGIIGSLIYYFIIYIYYKILKRYSKNRNLRVYFFMILLFAYIYNIKDFYHPVNFFVLFLMSLIEFPKRSVINQHKSTYTTLVSVQN